MSPAKSFGKLIARSVTFTRPANTTPYSAKDSINVDLSVSGATNATPIVVTTPTHSLVDGDFVTISGVVGNTAANGSFYVKKMSNTSISLYTDKALSQPVVGNGDYVSGGDLARCFRLANVFQDGNGSGFVSKIQSYTNLSTFADQFRFHFYSSPVAAILDNAPYTIINTNKDKRLGFVDSPAFGTEGTGSDIAAALACGSVSPSLPLDVFNDESTPEKDLWFMVENLSSGTPASGQEITVKVTVVQN